MTTPPPQRNIDEQSVHVRLQSVTVSGDELSFLPAGVTAIVGGNNVGKSTLLREINELISASPRTNAAESGLIVDGVSIEKAGSYDQLLVWLDANAGYVTDPRPGYIKFDSGPVSSEFVNLYWARSAGLGALTPFFVHYSVALARANMVQPVAQRVNIASPPQHPIHVLQDDAALLQEINQLCQSIFRRPLTLDRLSAHALLRVGTPLVKAPPIDAVTGEYREALTKLPSLDVQGDGMRSLLGLVLPILTSSYSVVIVDEPEAFLHPPQAFQLGRTLAALAEARGIQVVLATHDRNLLAGLLAANSPVSVVRLDRTGDKTTAHQLHANEVEALWTDPVMRYSNVLEGLFHRVVVVTEADPDCRFFAAALDAIDETSPLPIAPSEVLFVPAGGKDGMAKIVRALRGVQVKVVAVPDLDLLDDSTKTKKLVEAFDGDWDELRRDYEVAINDLRAMPVEATCGQVVAQVQSALAGMDDVPWTEETKQILRPALRTRKSELAALKRYGVSAFAGQAAASADRLLGHLDSLGICCVREGELERLAPTLGISKGPAWLGAALKAGAHRSLAAGQHVIRVLAAAQVEDA